MQYLLLKNVLRSKIINFKFKLKVSKLSSKVIKYTQEMVKQNSWHTYPEVDFAHEIWNVIFHSVNLNSE